MTLLFILPQFSDNISYVNCLEWMCCRFLLCVFFAHLTRQEHVEKKFCAVITYVKHTEGNEKKIKGVFSTLRK